MEAADNPMPFNVGDVLRLKTGVRFSTWRPDSNKEVYGRLVRVTKINSKKWVRRYSDEGLVTEQVTGMRVKPEHRVKNVWIHPNYFEKFERFDLVRANIYADWLEENGETAAAEKLRTAFPLGDVR